MMLFCLELVRYMFTDDAWDKFQLYYNSKSKHFKFLCNVCRKSDENGEDLTSCKRCLKSYHYGCVRLKKDVKKKRNAWFCSVCKAKIAEMAEEISS